MGDSQVPRSAALLAIATLALLSAAILADALNLFGGAPAYGAPAGSGSRDAHFAGLAPPPATGAAIHASAPDPGSPGVVGYSPGVYGVWGTTDTGWGGYFHSDSGHGIRVNSDGSDHYDHAGYFTANGGWGVLAQSANNQAVRGEAGDVSGVSNPLGKVGVAGLGETRGVYAASNAGIGLYSRSASNYAGYFYSDGYRGILASGASGFWAAYFTNRGGSTQPGVYVGGTLVVSGAKTGYVVDICVNADTEPLEAGDLVAVVGASVPVSGEIPVMRVVKASADNAGAIVGVVDQRFELSVERVDTATSEIMVRPIAESPLLATGSAISPGEYLSVVTLGAFKTLKVNADHGAIAPGDLLTASPQRGFAMRTTDPLPGTVVGKALERFDAGVGRIAAFVSLR